MNANHKKVTRFFGVWAAEKELAWLNQMARSGWLLEEVKGLTYLFRSANSSNTVYQLNYQQVTGDNWQDYLDLFTAAGWTYVTSITNWHYFCADGDAPEIYPLHTDNASKIAMLRRLLSALLLTGWLPLFISLLFFSQVNEQLESGPFSLLLSIIGLGLILVEALLIYSLLRIMGMIGKLQRSLRE